MERKQSASPSSPCQRPHSFFDLRSPTPCIYSHLTPYSHSQVSLGKPFHRQRFQKVVKSSPREGPRSADDSAPNIVSEGQVSNILLPVSALLTLEEVCRKISGAPKNSSTKALLYELCAAYKWKPPLFDCLKEDGPSHLRRFILKVVVEIKAGDKTTVVEAFSEPKPRKKNSSRGCS